MKYYFTLSFFAAIIFINSGCSKNAELGGELQTSGQKSDVAQVFSSNKAPSLNSAIVAIQLLKTESDNSPLATRTLVSCAKNSVYPENIKTACILGIGFLNIEVVGKSERDSFAEELMQIYNKQSSKIQAAILALFSKKIILIENTAKRETVLQWLNGKIDKKISLYLAYKIWKSNKINIDDWFLQNLSSFINVTNSKQSLPGEIQYAFEILFHFSKDQFAIALNQYCPIYTHPALYSRCWRILGVLLDHNFTPQELSPYLKKEDGNWLLTFHGNNWNQFAGKFPYYATILTRE